MQEGFKVHYRDERGLWYPMKVLRGIMKDVPMAFAKLCQSPQEALLPSSLLQLLPGFADTHMGLFCLQKCLLAFAWLC